MQFDGLYLIFMFPLNSLKIPSLTSLSLFTWKITHLVPKSVHPLFGVCLWNKMFSMRKIPFVDAHHPNYNSSSGNIHCDRWQKLLCPTLRRLLGLKWTNSYFYFFRRLWSYCSIWIQEMTDVYSVLCLQWHDAVTSKRA